MIENVMRDLGGVGIFGVISVCLFFAFFAGMLLWVFCLKKPYLNSMRELPLEGEPGSDAAVTANPHSRHE